MYCSACGAECKREDAFCGECGTAIKKEDSHSLKTKKIKDVEEPKKRERKPNFIITKKNKILIGFALLLVALLFGSYQLGSHMYSPKRIASRYIEAVKNNDTNALYKYLEMDESDTTFVTKKVFQELTKGENKGKTIENYKITDITYGSGKLSATVSFKYTSKGSSTESTGQVYLTKQRKKNLFIFDSWKVNNSNDTTVVKDFTLKVPVGSKVTYAGIEVSSKYLEKNVDTSNTASSYDIYVLPQVFAIKTKVTASLANGITIEEDITPTSRYGSVTLNLTKDNLSDAIQKALNDKAKEIVTNLYGAAMERKPFVDIKESFEREGVNLETLENNYQDFASSITSDLNQLTKIDFKESSIYNLVTEGENLKVRFKMKYDYTVKYKSYFSNEEQTHDDSSSSYVTLIMGIDGNNYYLVDFENLITYFSKY